MGKKIFITIIFLLLLAIGATLIWPTRPIQEILSPLGQSLPRGGPLEKYYFENLRDRGYPGSEIKLEKIIKKELAYTSWLFSFQAEGKKVTGMANIPVQQNSLAQKPPQYPVIIMMRGYADDAIYFTGLGTRKAAGVFAGNGFITLAPDFLGFGGSDTPPTDILEARFERPVTILNLLASVKSLPQANVSKIFFWGHSNGGQIALSVLEINQKPIPTVLWAPVSLEFPQSVLQYMGELDDQGRKVKSAIEEYESKYDVAKVSVGRYLGDVQGPIQLHQGERDVLVKKEWSDNLVEKLKDLGKEVTYYTYPKSDHNLEPDWNTVVSRDVEFFKKFLN